MEQVIKYSANQGSFSSNKNIVDIEIPAGSGVYDLSKSYINVNVSVNATSNTLADAVYPVSLAFVEGQAGNATDNAKPPTNAVLVKHISIENQAKGMVEQIRDNDVLRSALAIYEKDMSYASKDLGTFGATRTENPFNVGGVNELYSTGNVLSRNRNQDIRIDLKDCLGFGVVDAYDVNKHGKTRIHAEMNFNKITTVYADEAQLVAGAYRGVNRNAIDDIAGTGANITVITTTAVYNSEDDSPFYTNMPLTVTSSVDGANAENTDAIVSSIRHLASGKMELTMDRNLRTGVVANGTTFNTATVAFKNADNFSTSINKVELVAYKNNSVSEGAVDIQFSSFHTQSDAYPQQTELNRQYFLPANCMNFIISSNKPIYPDATNLSSYRISLDNKPTTNRDVEVKSALHYDMLNKTFLNMGRQLRNNKEKLVKNNNTEDENAGNLDVRIIASPVPLQARQTQLGLELNGSGNLNGNHKIFSHVIKQI